MKRGIVASFVLMGFGSVASAQQERGSGLLLSASGGYLDVNFKDSLKAVTIQPDKEGEEAGSSGGGTFGGDVGYVFNDHLFFTLGARVFSKNGERVFVADPGSPVFKLGFPLKLKLVPAQATVGWRFGQQRVFSVPLTPYVGIGGGLTSYREESSVAGEAHDFSVTKAGVHGLVGVEFGGGRLRFAVEAAYSSVPDAIGDSPTGVSKIYGEKDIGSTTILGKIVFTTSKR